MNKAPDPMGAAKKLVAFVNAKRKMDEIKMQQAEKARLGNG